jgi:gamma-glutamylcyclotransferase (GGCT)/AIG2-like uncharacterized protein YtfP
MTNNLNLAVYGTLRTGKGRKGYIEGYKLVHPIGAFFPAIIKGDGKVVVEVTNINYNELQNIDRYEGVYHGLYKREIKEITLNKNNKKIKAYIYVGKNIGEYNELETGDWNIEKKKLNL